MPTHYIAMFFVGMLFAPSAAYETEHVMDDSGQPLVHLGPVKPSLVEKTLTKWSPSSLVDKLANSADKLANSADMGTKWLANSADKLANSALYNLDKLANATIDDFNESNMPGVRKEAADARPRQTHHKLVVLFFIITITFLVGVICMTAVFYSREKLDHDYAGYGSFGVAKQHKAGLFTALRGGAPKDEGKTGLEAPAPPPSTTLYKQALMAHQAAIAAKESGQRQPPRRKTTPLPSIDEGNSVGYAPSDAGSDLETQSLSSQPGFSVAVTDSDSPITGTQRGFLQPRDRW